MDKVKIDKENLGQWQVGVVFIENAWWVVYKFSSMNQCVYMNPAETKYFMNNLQLCLDKIEQNTHSN